MVISVAGKVFTHNCDTGKLSALVQCWNIVQKIERGGFQRCQTYVHIYMTLKFLALQGAPYVYDISRVRVKIPSRQCLKQLSNATWSRRHRKLQTGRSVFQIQTQETGLPSNRLATKQACHQTALGVRCMLYNGGSETCECAAYEDVTGLALYRTPSK
jgi:hypothetical protein